MRLYYLYKLFTMNRIGKKLYVDSLVEGWHRLGGTLKILQFQSQHHGQGLHPLYHVQSLIQPGWKLFQRWVIHSFSGQPVSVPLCSLSKEVLPNTQHNYFSSLYSPCPVIMCQCKKTLSLFLYEPPTSTERPQKDFSEAFSSQY